MLLGFCPLRRHLLIDEKVGSLIDFYTVQVRALFFALISSLGLQFVYFIQFYDQGVIEYTTCDSLLTTSSAGTWPNTALFQIIASGVAVDKLVFENPATSSTGDANSGYIDPNTLAVCVSAAVGKFLAVRSEAAIANTGHSN